MNARELLAPDVSAPLGRSQGRVLELLREAGTPLGVQEVASRCGLHPNTVRCHLDALVEAGLATREPQLRATPGRPSIVYHAGSNVRRMRHRGSLSFCVLADEKGWKPRQGWAHRAGLPREDSNL
jgi:predicted ArsR family transcriptional regulator